MRLHKRVDDLMENDGGWWTAAQVAERLGANPDSVKKVFERGRHRYETRPVPYGSNEWRWRFGSHAGHTGTTGSPSERRTAPSP